VGAGMTYIPSPQKEEGGQKKIWTSDDNVKEILLAILERLEQIELHLSLITEEQLQGE
jgi:hypothetical protein